MTPDAGAGALAGGPVEHGPEVTGEPLSLHHGRHPALGPLAGASIIRIAIVPDRATLYDRIDRRSAAMMDAGALSEVRDLLALGLDPSLPAMRAIGVGSASGLIGLTGWMIGAALRVPAPAEGRTCRRLRSRLWISGLLQ